ncbi:MAG: hypothetical protein RL199_1886 [Pseudomonadota bacterium]|jgi:geranylgeranyl pyrophosphate synthase
MTLPSTLPLVTDASPVRVPAALSALEAYATPRALVDLLGDEAGAVPPRVWRTAFHEPAATFLAEPGKGFRSALVALGWEAGGGTAGACPEALSVVLEWLHAGSLIIDDIEDGSRTRRGRPALHVSHGLPIALNTGNTLYFQAQLLLEHAPLPIDVRGALQSELVSTMVRCHHGQALDLAATVEMLSQHELPGVVRATTALKTGALARLAAFFGARAAGATPQRLEAVARFGHELGVALQMLDDLGSLLSPRRRDKAVEDLVGGHPTWVWAWLAETVDPFTFARLLAELRAVRAGGDVAPLLGALDERVAAIGRAKVDEQCERMFRPLGREFGDSPFVEAAQAAVDRLRSSYV